ncbi:hypothetical protein [Chryseobacterium echinoideorum]|uniref:hypothetical protein n=1 Tax=Chryseobacterium echinoideorum TaxID=1549648 RepID=UPI0011868968|nr:hypothetical protein [Chryseobacterium echinoideorum]
MKKNIIFLGALLLSSAAYSQVGINNETPKATLDVTAKTTNGTKPEGIIAPRLTGDQIKSADTQYDTPQIGTIVYATAAVGTSTPKTVNITSPGYYYFDNNLVWQKFGSGTAAVDTEPWYIQNTSTQATTNSENIYQQGKVAVGFSDTDAVSGKQFEVKGDVKSVVNNAGTYSILETNNTDFFGIPINLMGSADNTDVLAANNYGLLSSYSGSTGSGTTIEAKGAEGTASVGANVTPGPGSRAEMRTGNSTVTNAVIVGSNGATDGNEKVVLLSENTAAITATRLHVDKTNGVTLKYGGIMSPSGNYTFPQNNGTAGQVLVTDGALPTLTTGAQLSWQNVSDLIQNNDWHITGNTDIVAGTNFLGTTSANKVALEFRVNGERAGYIGDDNTNTVGAQGLYKTTLGYQAGMGTTGDRVTAIGNHALSQNTAQNNTAIGAFALQKNVTGQNNMAVGDNTLVENTGRRNAAIGSNALNSNTTGEGNTAIGYRANASNVAGSFNTFIGSQAGEGVLATGAVTDANSSIAIGRGTTMGAGLTNAMVIGAYGSVTQSNSMVLGALPGTYAGVTVGATKVGIGTTAPSNTLHIVATADPLKLEGLQAGTATDEVLVVNNNVVKKVTAGSLASSLEPWQNQSDATKATSNTAAIYQTGNVSIGSQTPIAPFTSNGSTITPKLSVTGDVASTGAFYTNTSKYADYVFEDYFDGSSTINEDYKFKSLAETAAYIKENKHLPGVTSIKDVLKTENGYTVNLSELSIQQLEKIEELYLHTIEQQEEIAKQKVEISDLKSRMEKLEKLLLKENNK